LDENPLRRKLEMEARLDTVEERYLPEKVSLLRQKLGQKAKQEPRFRFYALYDRIYRTDVLRAVVGTGAPKQRSTRNRREVTIEEIGASVESEAAFLKEIEESLRKQTYHPRQYDACTSRKRMESSAHWESRQ